VAAPAFRAAGTVVGGTNTATVDTSGEYPASFAVGDVLVALVETANQTPALSASATITASNLLGWELLPGFSAGGTGTAGGTAATRVTAWWRRVQGTTFLSPVQANANGGNHVNIRVLAFTGCETDEDPFNVLAQATAAASTSVSFPSLTTTVAETLVVDAVAAPTDTTSAQLSSWSGASLTSYAERDDQFNTSGNGGGIGVGSGSLASAGSAGSRSATLASSVVQDLLSFALKPPQSISYTGFPVVESTTTGQSNANTTSHSVTLPATVNSGDLLVAVFTVDGNSAVTWDNATAGTWTELFNTTGSTAVRHLVRYKVADGTEDGLTLSIGTASEQASWRILRISGTTGNIEAGTPATAASTDTHAEFPNTPSLTPSWGSKKTLWIATLGTDDETNVVVNQPNNYQYAGGSTAGGAAGSGALTATYCYRKEAASESPSEFITEQGEDSVCCLIAVEPAAASGTGPTGTATETDTARSLGSARPAGLSAEADTALARTGVSVRAVGLATETDTAFTRGVARPAGRADEADTALPRGVARPVGRSAETDTALALAVVQVRAVGLAQETDTALPRGVARPAGRADETDTALPRGVARPAGRADETATAFARAAVQITAAGLATETDTALPRGAARPAGRAEETDTAIALTGVLAVDVAIEIDVATALAGVQLRAAGLATETDTAFTLAAAELVGVGLAMETDIAFALRYRRPRRPSVSVSYS